MDVEFKRDIQPEDANLIIIRIGIVRATPNESHLSV